MSIKCLIVDDEIHARKVLEKYIQDLPYLELVDSCKNAMEAMQALRNKTVDDMFLDINMPKLTGLNFLASLTHPPLVVVTTAYREYALDAFELDVIDYLHKPIPFPRFIRAVGKVEEKLQYSAPTVQANHAVEIEKPEDFIFVRADKKSIKLNFADIVYIEGLSDYVKIHTLHRSIVTKLTVKRLEELLPKKQFPRIHKSYIVSLQHIDAIDGNQVEIANKKLPIGQSYRQGFMQLIQSFMKK